MTLRRLPNSLAVLSAKTIKIINAKELLMKKILWKCFMPIWIGLAYSAVAQNQPANPNQTEANKPQTILSEAVTGDATVQDVNPRKRLITLKDAEGHTIRLRFNEPAPNIAQLHKGDEV